jgi:glycosyltransferase involved in cell wall biosynthesis
LQQCLHQLKPENQKKVDLFGKSIDSNCTYEVIVSDDGNAEQTKKSLGVEYEWVKFKQGKKKGPAANRNNGAKHANGEWLVFTDDDCLPQTNWLLKLHREIKEQCNPNLIAIEGMIEAEGDLDADLIDCPLNKNWWKILVS